MKKLDYKAGQYIFKAGDKGKEIFLLMSGVLVFFCQQMTQKIQILRLGKMKFSEKWALSNINQEWLVRAVCQMPL